MIITGTVKSMQYRYYKIYLSDDKASLLITLNSLTNGISDANLVVDYEPG